MDETTAEVPKTLCADLRTLHRQLEELFARAREENGSAKDGTRKRDEPPIFSAGK